MEVNVNYKLPGGCHTVVRALMLTALVCCLFGGNASGMYVLPGVDGDTNYVLRNMELTGPLRMGDKVPDIEFQMMNYDKPVARLSDFKGKLVILDFWATWCGSCIAAFPAEQQLKEQFGDKLEILLVNNFKSGDNKEKVNAFLAAEAKNKHLKITMPVVMNDTVATRFFPHHYIPHYVWITPSGEVGEITGAYEVNAANIQAMLDGNPPVLPVKDDNGIVNFDKPFLVNNSSYGSGAVFSSIITKSVKGGITVDALKMTGIDSVICVRFFDQSPLELYRRVYPEIDSALLAGPGMIVLEHFGKEPAAFWGDTPVQSGSVGVYEHRYSYECFSAIPVSRSRMYAYMKADLHRYFGYQISVEERWMPCYIVEDGPGPPIGLYVREPAKTADADDLISWMKTHWKVPVLDKRKNDKYSHLDVAVDKRDDIMYVKQEMAKIGLNLRKSERPMKVIVVRK